MDEIQFSYEITHQDYAEANRLLWRKLNLRRTTWLVPLLGIAVLAVPFLQTGPDGQMKIDITALPLFTVGFLLLYCGIRYQMPSYVLRQGYVKSGLQNRTFTAFVSTSGFRVQGVFSEWKYAWPAVLIADESENLMTLYTGLQVFIFPKRHIGETQLAAVRQLITKQPQFPGGTVPKY
jgi:hypothetical protein